MLPFSAVTRITNPHPLPSPQSAVFSLQSISLTANWMPWANQTGMAGGRPNVVVQVKSFSCHPTLACFGNEWLIQNRGSRQVTERSLGLPNLRNILPVSFALKFPREYKSFFCWVFLRSKIYSWEVEPTVLTAAFFSFIFVLLGQWRALFSFNSGCHSLFLKILFGFALKMASLAGHDSLV